MQHPPPAAGSTNTEVALRQVAAVIEQQIEEFHSLRQSMREGKITMIEIAPCSFLCLVRGRMKTSPMFLGDHLFIFMPQEVPTANLPRYISKLFLNLPGDAQEHLTEAISKGRLRFEDPNVEVATTL